MLWNIEYFIYLLYTKVFLPWRQLLTNAVFMQGYKVFIQQVPSTCTTCLASLFRNSTKSDWKLKNKVNINVCEPRHSSYHLALIVTTSVSKWREILSGISLFSHTCKYKKNHYIPSMTSCSADTLFEIPKSIWQLE